MAGRSGSPEHNSSRTGPSPWPFRAPSGAGSDDLDSGFTFIAGQLVVIYFSQKKISSNIFCWPSAELVLLGQAGTGERDRDHLLRRL
jgi:hypothetical protein